MREIIDAVHSLLPGKTPGMDGIPPKFFRRNINDIKEELWELVIEVFQEYSLCRTLNTSRISLLPKHGDLSQITNYRPISLLGTIYKIIAKIISNRMLLFLPTRVKEWQTAFVPGRSILNNEFMANEAIDWAMKSNQELVILLLHFERAYDRVSWKFLKETLLHMGFDPQWVELINTLYKEASACVTTNGHDGKVFHLQRSIRQSCPLAPYLYLFVGDLLGYMLNDTRRGIKGIRLPDNSTSTSQMLADDTALFLHASPKNLNKMLSILNMYTEASIGKLNFNESVAIYIGHTAS